MDESRRIRAKCLQKDTEANERRGSVHKGIRTSLFPNRSRAPGSSKTFDDHHDDDDDDALLVSEPESF